MPFRNVIKKITKDDLLRNGILIISCLVVVYSNILQLKAGNTLVALIIIGVSLVPFYLGTASFFRLTQKLESSSEIKERIEAVIFSLVIYGAVVLLIWLRGSTDLRELWDIPFKI